MSATPVSQVNSAYDSLRSRVLRVAALHKRCAVTEGGGRLVWWIGLPLLIVVVVRLVQFRHGPLAMP